MPGLSINEKPGIPCALAGTEEDRRTLRERRSIPPILFRNRPPSVARPAHRTDHAA